jgi:hypothetical protein
MKLTLHDNIHSSGGVPNAEGRPRIALATRASWVRAMHKVLAAARRDPGGCDDVELNAVSGGPGAFAADLAAGGVRLRVRGRRHGSALSVVWSVGAEERIVAASVLLAGRVGSDDAAAVAAIAAHVPRLPFGEADYAGAAAERRPCLATLYLDARWYDNARIELAATALALAALHGPGGRLNVGQEAGAASRAAAKSKAPPPPPHQQPKSPPAPSVAGAPGWTQFGPLFHDAGPTLKFDFTRPRLELVMRMVAKKANAAMASVPGAHFRVYPPADFLRRPGVLNEPSVFEMLKDSSWCVRWYDGSQERLSFGELLGFVHQIIEIENAYLSVVQPGSRSSPGPKNYATWGVKRSNGSAARVPVKVRRALDTRELTKAPTIRRLLSSIAIQAEPDNSGH